MVERLIPEEQWAVVVSEKGKIKVDKIKVPTPGPGQVLVKMECAPINPSDIYFMEGKDEDEEEKVVYPIVPGWEGAGTVVANGGGLMGWKLNGNRVAVAKCQEPDGKKSIGGCYQQYMITDAMSCLELPNDVSFEDGSMHLVNPLTAIGLIETLQGYKAQAGIQNAAASQLGRMIIRLCQEERIPLINIVRKEDQVKMLKEELKCEYVLNSSDPDFLDQLGELAKKLRATVCFDAIAGKLTGQIMSRMPSGSVIINFGRLSEEDIGDIDPLLLIGRNQKLTSFYLADWIGQKSLLKKLRILSRCQKYLRNKMFSSVVAKKISLFEFENGLKEYKTNMTTGKYLVYPQIPPQQSDLIKTNKPLSDKENEEVKQQ